MPGSSAYPGALDNLQVDVTNAQDQDDHHPDNHNAVNAAVNAIQGVLGLNPQGEASNLAERLDGLSSGLPNPFAVARATRQASAPSAAAAGETKFQFRDAARAPLIQMLTDVGDPMTLLPGISDPLVSGWWVEANSIRYKSLATALVSDGTVTQSTIASLIAAQNYATVASTNAGAGLYSASALYRDGSAVGDGGLYWGLLSVPDVSYGSGATGAKIVTGIHDSVGHNGARPGGNGVLLEYNTNQGDANWQLIVSNGGVNTIVDTGVAFAAGTAYVWMLHIPRGGSSCYGHIAALGGSGATVAAAAMPGSTAMYYVPVRLTTLSAVSRSIRGSSGFIRHGGAW